MPIILQVSGFPSSYTPEQVRRVFEPFGVVQAVRRSGDGADFDVEMAEPQAAEAAQTLLEGLAFGERPLHVTRADGAYSAVA